VIKVTFAVATRVDTLGGGHCTERAPSSMRILLGSVAEHVVRAAQSSVLVVRLLT
jgi:nucleotide-binding universal stress UspA family protein